MRWRKLNRSIHYWIKREKFFLVVHWETSRMNAEYIEAAALAA